MSHGPHSSTCSQKRNPAEQSETTVSQTIFVSDAAKLQASVTITDANYTVALKLLGDRYQNNSMSLRAHVRAISTQKNLTKQLKISVNF